MSWPPVIEGIRLELIHDKNVLNYGFHPKGLVAVTAGTKEAVTGPLMYWCLDGLDLHIGDRPGKSSTTLHLLEATDDEWTIHSVSAPAASQFRYSRTKTP